MENLNSSEWVLFNLRDDKVLSEKDADLEVPVASLTKIMTTILAIEENDSLSELIEITSEMTNVVDEYVVANLPIGTEVPLEELLYITMLPSAADAAQALAIKTSGSIEAFVNLMNQKATELGMNQTHFSNPVGIDGDNYSTANDIAILLKYALKNPKFKEVFESFSYYSPTLDLTYKKTIPGNDVISGAKTGFTNSAGRCLASTATLNDVPYLLINLGADWQASSTLHVEDALNVYNYYSTNYSYQTILNEGDVMFNVVVSDSDTKSLDFLAKQDVEAYLENDFDMAMLDRVYEGVSNITNDNKVGDYLGEYKIMNDDEILYETAIYLEAEIEFYPYWLWNTGVVCGGILLVLFAILIWRKKIRQSAR